MYWYVKYPLIALCIIAVIGLGILVFRSCTPDEFANTDSPAIQTQTAKPAAGQTATAQPAAAPQDNSAEFIARLDAIQKQIDAGNLEAARRMATILLNDKRVVEFDSTWFEAAQMINDVNYKFMNTTAPCREKQRYMVKSGDTMQRIADSTITSTEFLLRLNPAFRREKGDPIIHQGDALFYIPTAWSIRVIKHRYLLILYRDDQLYRIYNIGIGKENRTPVGQFVISGRQEHPSWTPPGKNIPYGNPENILGTHWLALSPIGNTDPGTIGYGIHGTWDDDSIGTAASSGCVRMHNEDVNELYDIIPNPGKKCPPVFVTIEE